MGPSELKGAPSPLYSETALDHIRQPRNVGRLEPPCAVGLVDDPTTENQITIYLRMELDRLVEVRFRALACSACIAASSVTTVLAQGLSRCQARTIGAADIVAALDGLPLAKHHCAELAATALARALDILDRLSQAY